MADNQELHLEGSFKIVEALYHEATLTLPADERPHGPQGPAEKSSEKSAGKSAGKSAENLAPKPIIRSRKPRNQHHGVPIITRISDLYEEAEATRLLAETAHIAPTTAPQDDTLTHEAAHQDETQTLEDDFTIPANFGQSDVDELQNLDTPDLDSDLDSDSGSESGPEALAHETAHETVQAAPLASEEELALLAQSTSDDEAHATDEVTISAEIEPAIALDDVLDGLLAQEDKGAGMVEQGTQGDPQVDPKADSQADSQAYALAALDATRPQADDELTQQLADVKSAVENAQFAAHQLADEAPHDEQEDAQKDDKETLAAAESDALSPLTAGPALATFIGETVRDVLDEELPQLVRGLVDEALGERQGRYGRSDTPHIGLRTKPARH